MKIIQGLQIISLVLVACYQFDNQSPDSAEVAVVNEPAPVEYVVVKTSPETLPTLKEKKSL